MHVFIHLFSNLVLEYVDFVELVTWFFAVLSDKYQA